MDQNRFYASSYKTMKYFKINLFFLKAQIIVKVREEPWKQFRMILVSVQVSLIVFTTKIIFPKCGLISTCVHWTLDLERAMTLIVFLWCRLYVVHRQSQTRYILLFCLLIAIYWILCPYWALIDIYLICILSLIREITMYIMINEYLTILSTIPQLCLTVSFVGRGNRSTLK